MPGRRPAALGPASPRGGMGFKVVGREEAREIGGPQLRVNGTLLLCIETEYWMRVGSSWPYREFTPTLFGRPTTFPRA
jgi:hypothetical protein